MIEMYHEIAVRLNKLRSIIWLCLIISLGACIYILFSDQHTYNTDKQLSFFVLPMWFLSMIVLTNLFIGTPPKAADNTGRLKRIVISIQRLLYWIVALVFSVITMLTFYLSYKAIMFAV